MIINKERYDYLVDSLKKGANLSPTELEHISDYEQYVIPAIASAVKAERDRLLELLDARENDMGFVEISNHVSWQSLNPDKEGE